MARKHNTKHSRSPSKYPERLATRGLTRSPRMKWTGLTYDAIGRVFDSFPHYRWVRNDDGYWYRVQIR